MSPKFGNILGSFGLIILAQSFIFHNLCIIFQYVYVICMNKGRHSSLVANTCSFQVFWTYVGAKPCRHGQEGSQAWVEEL